MSKFIDVNTFEIVDNVFEVDDDIAETISILNKKSFYKEIKLHNTNIEIYPK